MQLEHDEHFDKIVLGAWQAYKRAESQLTHALKAKDHALIDAGRYTALREGAAACFFLHHYAELVFHRPPPQLAGQFKSIKELRAALAENCFMLRSDNKSDDVNLLGDVADALKHSVLWNGNREVSSREAVLVTGTGYGVIKFFGEGKYGGTEQVLVLGKSGTRALSSILQNVIDAWRKFLGWHLPAIGET